MSDIADNDTKISGFEDAPEAGSKSSANPMLINGAVGLGEGVVSNAAGLVGNTRKMTMGEVEAKLTKWFESSPLGNGAEAGKDSPYASR